MEGRTKGSAYKMKGSPMQRNFGIGSPMKHDDLTKEDHEHPHLGTQDGEKGTYHSEKEYDFRKDLPGDQKKREKKERRKEIIFF